MKFKQYLNEAIGKFPEKIERTAYLTGSPSLMWVLKDTSSSDDKRNYKHIEDIAYKELMGMKRKGLLDFYEDAFDLSKISGARVGVSYHASVTLIKFEPKKLEKELRRLNFKVK